MDDTWFDYFSALFLPFLFKTWTKSWIYNRSSNERDKKKHNPFFHSLTSIICRMVFDLRWWFDVDKGPFRPQSRNTETYRITEKASVCWRKKEIFWFQELNIDAFYACLGRAIRWYCVLLSHAMYAISKVFVYSNPFFLFHIHATEHQFHAINTQTKLPQGNRSNRM